MRNEQELDWQIDRLVEDAPQDGVTPGITKVLSSVLKAIALQLNHSSYYILQSQDGSWLLTTLSNRNSPDIEKNVVYAYCSSTASNLERLKQGDRDLVSVEIGIIEILFRLVGLKEVDSLILFDKLTDTQRGTEISRAELQTLCEKQMQKLKNAQRKLQRNRSPKKGFAPHIA
ncbi:hypothetical protein [Pseudanabaena sp. PCC 6802]|uniref:hypothetical protein n=1 Tax=Pseudanabaena sp. PCC 6802 TaxID=118173 RepID=UPI00034D0C7F|nr:hypothetical protein [Pseudanabaena sp. PCC 6802]